DNTHEKKLFDLALLPAIRWTAEQVGSITAEAAAASDLPLGLPVMTGTADAAAEALGSGLHSVGDMMMMYGSSNFFIFQTHALKPIPEFWASNFLLPGTTVITGGMATVGSLFNWLNDTFPGRSFHEWETLSKKSQPGANGVVVLPYFAGERTPLFDPDAKGVFFGMQLTTTPGDIFQAVQEAIGFGIRHNLEMLEKAGEQAKRIIAIGGVASSDVTMQIISDVTGCPQQLPKQRLGACYGDAYLAAYGSGWMNSLSDIDTWISLEKEFTPNPEHTACYQDRYAKFRELYETTKHLMHS
ncbi:MAG: FGGY-family carbohydrate kinase, partial [Spirochaetales bacterium]|nr:FGGY-family carbohydrate kinase [Spirochaetales bacterium]